MARQLRCCALAAALLAAADAGAEDRFKLVAHAATGVKRLTRAEVSDLFLKRSSQLPGGAAAVPVDQSAVSPVRQSFSTDVLEKKTDAVLQYWQQQIFSGRGTPPQVKQTDAEVLAFVAQTAGAIGYVARDTALPSGVTVVEIAPED
jgi:ABC-type phosphate transport system substrate-binding protein